MAAPATSPDLAVALSAASSPMAAVARSVASARFDQLPRSDGEAAKRLTLDGGANRIVVDAWTPGRLQQAVIAEYGGAPPATVLATGAKPPTPNMALLNSAGANRLDIVDADKTLAHPGATAISPAVAVGESVGARVRRPIYAVVAGYTSLKTVTAIGEILAGPAPA